MNNSLDIDIAWGGYYASTSPEEGTVSIFRLLDFNRDAYHAAFFREKFTVAPTMEEAAALSPFIGHAPIDARALLQSKDLQLVGSKPLTQDDLDGYAYYLEAHGMTPEETQSLLNNILQFAQQPPLKIRMEIVNDELAVSVRE